MHHQYQRPRKRVAWDSQMTVVLIPSRREYYDHSLQDSLWYSQSDFAAILMEAVEEAKQFIRENGHGMKIKTMSRNGRNDVDVAFSDVKAMIAKQHMEIEKIEEEERTKKSLPKVLQEEEDAKAKEELTDQDRRSSETREVSRCEQEKEKQPTSYKFTVRMKRTLKVYEVSKSDEYIMALKIGALILVNGDKRTTDMGFIVSKEPIIQQKQTSYRDVSYNHRLFEIEHSQHRILREVTQSEKASFVVKENDERLANECFSKALTETDMDIPVTVLDAEYQTDYRKLTIFYREDSDMSVSQNEAMTEISRKMSAIFKARVWMKKVDAGEQILRPIHPTALAHTLDDKSSSSSSSSVSVSVSSSVFFSSSSSVSSSSS